MSTWYDHPQYFDMVFRDETAGEVSFFEKAFHSFVPRPVSRVLEPGCGGGRLVVDLAAKGYAVTGLDLNQRMLNYLGRRLRRRGLQADLIRGDMTAMNFDEDFDAAFCTFNTFRHLLSDRDAVQHLRSVADHLHGGGIYILGMHLIPLDADPECIERWSASHGGTRVHVTIRVVDFNRKTRQETLRVSVKAQKPSGAIQRIRSEFPLRIYTPDQARELLAQVDDVFEIAGIYDFDYDIDQPRKFDEDLTDALFVLRKRTE